MFRSRATAPSWLVSMILHLVLLLLVALTLQIGPPRQAPGERTANVGIVLKKTDGETNFFQGPDEDSSDTSAGSGASGSSASSADQLLSEPSPLDPSSALPAGLAIIGPGALEEGAAGGASGAAGGGNKHGRGIGGTAKTGVFGLSGEGYKFVYVFDRSASMNQPGRNVLAAAKGQILESIDSLDQTHQFQVIFYNEQPRRFMQFEAPNKLFFANERNRALVRKFVGSITARGGTEHKDALLMAIKLQPDVIFFLTDAAEPEMSAADLAEINRRAAGIVINVVEFGFGPQSDPNSWVVRLARQNGGQYLYGDVTKMFPAR